MGCGQAYLSAVITFLASTIAPESLRLEEHPLEAVPRTAISVDLVRQDSEVRTARPAG